MIELSTLPQNAANLETLRSLSADLQQKGVRSSLHAAGKPLIQALKSTAPNDNLTAGNRLAEAINKTVAKPGRAVRTGAGKRYVKPESQETALLVGPNKKVSGKYVGYIGWFLEEGTKAHKIGPKYSNKNKRLKIWNNVRTFSGGRTVNHPGAIKRNWQTRALQQAQPQMESAFYTGLAKWIEKHGR